ncbi:MAG: glycosyltransferase [DPANN group archaeon]|nr:glycosyltransferase [DPANN group archaeon]
MKRLNRKTILLAIPRPWDQMWGQEKDLINELNSTYDITVLEWFDRDNFERKYTIPNNTQIVFRKTKINRGLASTISNTVRSITDVLKYPHDIYITYNTLSNTFALILEKLRGKKVLLIYADDLPELYKTNSYLAYWLTKYIANPIASRVANKIVVTASLLEKDIDVGHKTTWIPNGVNLSLIKRTKLKKSGRFTVGFVGGFGNWVDFDIVISVAQRNMDIDFLLVGDGEEYSYVKNKTKGLKNVILTGMVHKDRANGYMGMMSVCLIPFKKNRVTDRVSPIKLFEYWGHGKPVIVSRCYEMVKTGKDLVLYADNAEELEQQILKLENDDRLRSALAKKSINEVKNFDWKVLGHKYKEILKSL